MTETTTALPIQCDVVIAGLGPVGATLANLLAMRGRSVVVLERETDIYDQPRAITADHEAMRAFQAAGLADEIAASTCPHPGTDFLGVEGQVIKRFYPLPAPGPLGWEPTFMFYQPALERSLRTGLARFAKVQVRLGHEVIEHRQHASGVEVHAHASDGTRCVVHARYLMACDGARSPIRKQLGIASTDLGFDEWWLVIDAQLVKDIVLPERCVQYCRPSRPGTYIVGPERLRRWEIKVLPGEDPQIFQDRQRVAEVLARFVDVSALEIQRVAIYRFHAVVAEHWRSGRVFLLGDAAHQTPPFLGQGMCAGIRDAFNLAWKLDQVLSGKAASALLDSYMQERRPHVQQVVEHAKSFGLIIGELDEVAAVQRDARLRAQLLDGSVSTVRQAFIPDLEDGLLARAADGRLLPGAGKLFPQPWVRCAGGQRCRFDTISAGRFCLVGNNVALINGARLALAGLPVIADLSLVVLHRREPMPAGVIGLVEEDALIEAWLQHYGADVALVRPDGVCYGTASSTQTLRELLWALCQGLDPASVPLASPTPDAIRM